LSSVDNREEVGILTLDSLEEGVWRTNLPGWCKARWIC
jgi:hypothetical protein